MVRPCHEPQTAKRILSKRFQHKRLGVRKIGEILALALELVAASGLGDLAGGRELREGGTDRRAAESGGGRDLAGRHRVAVLSAARTASLGAPGAVRERAGAAAELAGFSEVRGVRRAVAPALLAALCAA